MDCVTRVRDTHVFDNVLSDEDFQEIREFVNIYPYERTDAILWQKAWSIADGAILRGPQLIARAPNWTLVPPERPSKELRPFPADPPALVKLLDKVREACMKYEELPDITGAVLSPYVWPPGTSIAWHSDGMSLDNRGAHKVAKSTPAAAPRLSIQVFLFEEQ